MKMTFTPGASAGSAPFAQAAMPASAIRSFCTAVRAFR